MIKKIPLLLVTGMVTALAIILTGCGTEDPWSPDPSRPLVLSMVSGPADTVAYGSNVSFSWKSAGGTGEVEYQYRLDSGDWSSPSNATSVTYFDVTAGATFNVMAADAGGATDQVSRQFWVGTQPSGDTTPPTVWITASPAEGSFVAAGSTVHFSWDGSDDVDGDNVLFWYSFADVTSDTSAARVAAFDNVAAADPAVFSVWAMDQSGNTSEPASVSFIIKDASILYVDDFLWVGDPAMERDQKQFYRDALAGYAFAEWDIAVQGFPDSSDLVTVGGEPIYSTILFASDHSADDGTWWYDVGSVPGGGALAYYMESGGRLIAAGAFIMPWIYNSNPPVAGDFEFEWFGIDSVGNDDGIAWDYWADFTWAVDAGNFPGMLPDSMKIDVAKNGDQVGNADDIFSFRDSCVTLYVKGLDIDGEEPYDYGVSVGHIYYPDGGDARCAMINFDCYSMGLPGITQTIQLILSEFGE